VPTKEEPSLNYDDVIVLDEKNRMFSGWSTAEIKDKQGDLIPFEVIKKNIPTILKRRAPITLKHTNKIVGETLGLVPGIHPKYKVPAVNVIGRIFDDYRIDNEAWSGIKNKIYKGLSMGGQQAVRNEKGEVSWVEQCELGLVKDGANPGATIDAMSMAKSEEPLGTGYDIEQIKIGIGEEMEHTNDPQVALKITLDHLNEDKEYYSKLAASGLAEVETEKACETRKETSSAKEDGNMSENKPEEPKAPVEDAKKEEPGTQEPVAPAAEPEEDKYVTLEKRMSKMEESIPAIVKEAVEEALKPAAPEMGKEEPAPEAKPAEAKPEKPKEPESAPVAELNKSLETSATPRPTAAEKTDAVPMEKSQEKNNTKSNVAVEVAKGHRKVGTLDAMRGKLE